MTYKDLTNGTKSIRILLQGVLECTYFIGNKCAFCLSDSIRRKVYMSSRIIAAVRNNEEFEIAVNSGADIIFMLSTNIENIKKEAECAHKNGKRLFVHIDLAEGVGKDEYGIRFVKKMGIDGIISTRTNLIKLAKKEGLCTVQRFFIVDSKSVETTLETVKNANPDMIEIMPGIMPKVIKKIKSHVDIPLVAGGLIENVKEIKDALMSGAVAISTGKKEFWESV